MIIRIRRKKPITNAKEVAEIFYRILRAENEFDREKEHFWGVYLNPRNIVKRIELVHLGTLDTNLCHPREVFRPAIMDPATQVIICHNHPSGDVDPSNADIEVTKRLVEAGKILGIGLLDHLIIGREEKDGFFSFKQKGLIK